MNIAAAATLCGILGLIWAFLLARNAQRQTVYESERLEGWLPLRGRWLRYLGSALVAVWSLLSILPGILWLQLMAKLP